MLSYQKALLEDLFRDGMAFHEALIAIDAIEWAEVDDARSTWRRWNTELNAQGFYSY